MENRRNSLLVLAGFTLSTAVLAGCGGEDDVGAVEDLMREHGILRRAILIFRETAGRLRAGTQVDQTLWSGRRSFSGNLARTTMNGSWRKPISFPPSERPAGLRPAILMF